MKYLLIAITFLFLSPLAVFSQAPECPAGKVCISQEAANKAAENARELEATKEKVKTLEGALVKKDESIREAQETARKNEADLREQLHKTEVELALKTGQLISKEAEAVRNLALIDLLLKQTKKKRNAVITIF